MPKCDFNKVASNFIEIALRHECSPVNLRHIFRTPFLKNTSGRLLLIIIKDKLSGLRKFLATRSTLKLMKNAFYFTSKTLFFLKMFKF